MTHYRPYPIPRRSVRKRVLDNIVEADRGYVTPCWVWLGEKDKHGYGRIKRDNRRVPTHWILKGDPPEGLESDHLCFQRDCVRPEHIEYVTRQENLRRRRYDGA